MHSRVDFENKALSLEISTQIGFDDVECVDCRDVLDKTLHGVHKFPTVQNLLGQY